MNHLHYTAELNHRQAALMGEAEAARQARRPRRPLPTGWRHRNAGRRATLAGPPGLMVTGT